MEVGERRSRMLVRDQLGPSGAGGQWEGPLQWAQRKGHGGADSMLIAWHPAIPQPRLVSAAYVTCAPTTPDSLRL